MGEFLRKAECLKNPKMFPWADRMEDTDYISTARTYESGRWLSLFEDRVYITDNEDIGNLRYYVYDPLKHGMPADKTYPVIFAFHGSGGSLVGKTAIEWAGVEAFASPEYQEKLGGAYIVVPLANEYRQGNGEAQMSWMTPTEKGAPVGYTVEEMPAVEQLTQGEEEMASLLGRNSIYTYDLLCLIHKVYNSFTNAGKKILFGTSAGGYAAWRLIITDPTLFDAALIMAGAYLPSRAELKKLEESGMPLWICHGKNDECVPFDLCIAPVLPELERMKNVSLYTPELVRRADRGVASNISGMQMGQHCINDCIHENLIYTDGEPMDSAHPEGTIGWINSLCG